MDSTDLLDAVVLDAAAEAELFEAESLGVLVCIEELSIVLCKETDALLLEQSIKDVPAKFEVNDSEDSKIPE